MRPRLPRIKRVEDVQIEEDAHSWAISYADFLMVLLSFFILFFSTSDRSQDLIQIISSQMKTKSGEGKGSGITGSNREGEVRQGSANYPKDLETVLSGFKLERDPVTKQMKILFEDNSYRMGSVDLTDDPKKRLEKLFEILLPHQDKVMITFIGHTDAKTVDRVKGKYIQNNFDLSVLRATRALKLALEYGFKPENLAARGAADYERSSRTLTLSILAMKDGTSK